MARAGLEAVSATDAGFGIDGCQEIGDLDGAMLADALAFHTSDATDIAVLHCEGSLVAVVAGHPYIGMLLAPDCKFYQGAGAGAYADAAGGAFIRIDLRKSFPFRNGYSSERTALDAVASSETTVDAVCLPLVEGIFDAAVGDAVIAVGRLAGVAVGGTFDIGYLLETTLRVETDGFGYELHPFRAGDDTIEVLKRGRVLDGDCEGVAACQTATAAVGAWEEGFDFGDARIFIDLEAGRGDIENDSGQQTDDAENYYGVEYHFFEF